MNKKIAISKLKYSGMSAQKVRLVADMIRNSDANEALNMLTFVQKYAAKPIAKALKSAIANATNNHEMDKKKLVISKLTVDEAPTLKRYRIASRHGPQERLKRSSHITVELTEK
ncbi:MAG: 50S ribosomal protein L22 [bacterium]